jgi:hypothetical protein
MKADGDRPLIASTATGLGVRIPGPDVVTPDVVPDVAGNVHPGAGMSVAPDDIMSLPVFRRPEEHAGTAKHPVWSIAADALPDSLEFIADRIDHGLIGPAAVQLLATYTASLGSTQLDWCRE